MGQQKTYDLIIIGAGVSGLAAAHFVLKQKPTANILILEKSDRAGGAIKTFCEDGFLAEWGAHGILDNVAETRELLDDLGAEREIVRAPLKDFSRYICCNGQLAALPQSPLQAIFFKQLLWRAKRRILKEPWIKPINEEQSVADWVAHRFGEDLLSFADVAMTGTYAGDMHRLSADAVFPQLRRLEQKHGSLIKGLFKNRKIFGGLKGLPSMLSFADGMKRLPVLLSKNKPIVYNSEVVALRRSSTGWIVKTTAAEIAAQKVIVATPINAALQLLRSVRTPPSSSVCESRLANVLLGFDETAIIPYGFGYLAPESEQRFSLGALFSTQMFARRAPAGQVLIEALVGGTRHDDRFNLSDEEIIARTLQDVGALIKIPAQPLFAKVLRPSSGIPQLHMGHGKLIQWRNELEQDRRGLSVFGFGWEGIGINDMIRGAKKVAQQVAGARNTTQDVVKDIYL